MIQFQSILCTISLLIPSLIHATPYTVTGNFSGADGAEIYGTLSINDPFSPSTIETAWQNYLSSSPQSGFFLELEYQITSFDFYRIDTDELFFHGDSGAIEVIITGQQQDDAPHATWYNAWMLQGTGSAYNAYSSREGNDVIFLSNGSNASDYDYDHLSQTIQLISGCYNDAPFNTGVNLTLTASQPVPEPNTLILLALGTLLVTKKGAAGKNFRIKK